MLHIGLIITVSASIVKILKILTRILPGIQSICLTKKNTKQNKNKKTGTVNKSQCAQTSSTRPKTFISQENRTADFEEAAICACV